MMGPGKMRRMLLTDKPRYWVCNNFEMLEEFETREEAEKRAEELGSERYWVAVV